MHALVLDGEPRVVDDHPEPRRAPDEALIQMRLAGVCDTDLQLARGYMSFRGILGHEFVGDVLECDEPGWVGRRVVADINAGCGDCPDCRESNSHHCETRTVLGIAGRDGALAERLVAPTRNLVEVPEHVPDERAVFTEPLAAAAHAVDALRMPDDGPVYVLGDGKLGLLTALVLFADDVDVTLVGHHASKLEVAARAGVPTLLEGEVNGDREAAGAVVEATGTARGLARAIELVRPRGVVVLKTTVADQLEVDLAPVVVNEVRLVGSRCGDIGRAVSLLADRRVDPTPLVSARYPLEQADQALQRAAEPGVLKVLVTGLPRR